jgi:hypothetical protein
MTARASGSLNPVETISHEQLWNSDPSRTSQVKKVRVLVKGVKDGGGSPLDGVSSEYGAGVFRQDSGKSTSSFIVFERGYSWSYYAQLLGVDLVSPGCAVLTLSGFK